MKFSRIFAAIDFSHASDAALLRAHHLAVSTGATIAVCHVIPNEIRSSPLFPHFASSIAANAPAEIARVTERVVQHLKEITGRTPEGTSIFVDHGSPYAEILKTAENWDADLIVIGSQGMTSAAGVLLGSVTHRVIRCAHTTVLVGRPARTGGIVAGTDFSDPTFAAISVAVDEARRADRQLTVVHCIDVERVASSCAAMALLSPSDADVAAFANSARGHLHEALRRLNAKAEAIVTTGSPAVALIQIAEDRSADLLVLGTAGLTGLTRVFLGSVAESVVSNAKCSVIVTRLPAHANPVESFNSGS